MLVAGRATLWQAARRTHVARAVALRSCSARRLLSTESELPLDVYHKLVDVTLDSVQACPAQR
jgi:hypothetical protein